MHFVSGFVDCSTNKGQQGTVCVEISTMTQITPLKIRMLYSLAFKLKALIERFQSVLEWGQYRGFEKRLMSLIVITKVWMLRIVTV